MPFITSGTPTTLVTKGHTATAAEHALIPAGDTAGILGTFGVQNPKHAGVPFISGRIQWGPAIASPRIDRNTGCKQNFDNINLSFLGCRIQQSLTVGSLGVQNLGHAGVSCLSSHVQRGPAIVRTQIDLGPPGEQELRNINMPSTGSRVQRGPAIASPRIDRNTDRKQNLDGADLSGPGCRMQQSPAVSPPRVQNLGYAGVSCLGSHVQRSPAITSPRIDRNTDRKQNLDGADLSGPGCRMQRSPAVSPLGVQNLGHAGVSCLGSHVQRSPAIISLRIDRNTDRKQSLDGADLSGPDCRMQRSPAVSPLGVQNLGHAGVSCLGSHVQRSPAIVRTQVDRNTNRKQDLDHADVSRLSSLM